MRKNVKDVNIRIFALKISIHTAKMLTALKMKEKFNFILKCSI